MYALCVSMPVRGDVGNDCEAGSLNQPKCHHEDANTYRNVLPHKTATNRPVIEPDHRNISSFKHRPYTSMTLVICCLHPHVTFQLYQRESCSPGASCQQTNMREKDLCCMEGVVSLDPDTTDAHHLPPATAMRRSPSKQLSV